MKKIIFAVALLVVIVGVSASEAQAAWFFKKKAETKVEVNTSDKSAAAVRAAFKEESSEPKLTIMKRGEVLAVIVGGATVKTNTSGTLTADVNFGTTVVALTIKTTTEGTKVFRHYDGKGSTVDDIAVGDNISLEGILDTTATSLTVTAGKIKDYSMQGAGANYGGVVSTLTFTNEAKTEGFFKLPLANQTNRFVTVFVSATTKIASTTAKDLKLSDMKNGDFVVGTKGIVNTAKSELKASEIKFSFSTKTTQSRIIYNQLAKVDVDQQDYSAQNDGQANVRTVFVKTTSGERLEVRIDESAMTGKFIMKNKKGDYETDKGVFKWMAKEKKSIASSLDGLALVAGDTVWVSGQNFVKDGTVNAYRFEKQFKQ